MEQRGNKKYIRPEEVRKSDAKVILDFLNAATTAQEIADIIEIPGERDVGVKVAQNILDRRAKLGKFTNLKQVDEVPQVGPERFAEIVACLSPRRTRRKRKRFESPQVRPFVGGEPAIGPVSSADCVEGGAPRTAPRIYVPPLVYPFGKSMPVGAPVVGYTSIFPEKCIDGLAPSGINDDCAHGKAPSGINSDCYGGSTPWGPGCDCSTGGTPKGGEADCFTGTKPTDDCKTGSSPPYDWCQTGTSPGEEQNCWNGTDPGTPDGDCEAGTSPTGEGGDCQSGTKPTGSDTECDIGSSK